MMGFRFRDQQQLRLPRPPRGGARKLGSGGRERARAPRGIGGGQLDEDRVESSRGGRGRQTVSSSPTPDAEQRGQGRGQLRDPAVRRGHQKHGAPGRHLRQARPEGGPQGPRGSRPPQVGLRQEQHRRRGAAGGGKGPHQCLVGPVHASAAAAVREQAGQAQRVQRQSFEGGEQGRSDVGGAAAGGAADDGPGRSWRRRRQRGKRDG